MNESTQKSNKLSFNAEIKVKLQIKIAEKYNIRLDLFLNYSHRICTKIQVIFEASYLFSCTIHANFKCKHISLRAPKV